MLPFVRVPAGTRHRFALDVGVDRADLVGSLDALTNGVERLIDIAEMNRRLFVNNVPLTMCGDAVRRPASAAPNRDPAVVLVSNNPSSFEQTRQSGTRAALDSG